MYVELEETRTFEEHFWIGSSKRNAIVHLMKSQMTASAGNASASCRKHAHSKQLIWNMRNNGCLEKHGISQQAYEVQYANANFREPSADSTENLDRKKIERTIACIGPR